MLPAALARALAIHAAHGLRTREQAPPADRLAALGAPAEIRRIDPRERRLDLGELARIAIDARDLELFLHVRHRRVVHLLVGIRQAEGRLPLGMERRADLAAQRARPARKRFAQQVLLRGREQSGDLVHDPCSRTGARAR